ncbi:DUF6968 family protein [Sorangium sp. So ce1078]|uniref:DUF6968 family protein n=1 Tax=Sorangium sp. So ce1078 TaxID=3133329 RepID=UPI003F5FBFD1
MRGYAWQQCDGYAWQQNVDGATGSSSPTASPPLPSARCWEADVEVAGAGESHKTHGVGIDAFQALYSALSLLPAMLVNYEEDGRLSWLDEEWTGFPELKLTAP